MNIDSVSGTCGRYPATCAAAMGQTDAAAGAVSAAATYQVVKLAAQAIDAALEARIEKALAECADFARSEVLIRHGFRTTRPTLEQCDEEVGRDSNGKSVTRAMRLGAEMHDVAEKCAEQRLNELRPGGFSIEQRYRYDPKTGVTTVVTQAEVQRGADLQGTLVPDVVIHDGNAINVQGVYDFKFPCFNLEKLMGWREYPKNHPSGSRDQGVLYFRAFRIQPQRVQPRIGVERE